MVAINKLFTIEAWANREASIQEQAVIIVTVREFAFCNNFKEALGLDKIPIIVDIIVEGTLVFAVFQNMRIFNLLFFWFDFGVFMG